MQYLGFRIGQGRILAILNKVSDLRDAGQPQTKNDLQHCIGLACYYRCFVPHFGTLATLLTDLTKGKGKGKGTIPVDWTPEGILAFSCLKITLCTYLVLHTPFSNFPFLVYTDASNVGLGTVLTQLTPQGE